MSLLPIIRALGGQLYAGGRRASIPAPGHSSKDRSISLLLAGERVLVHSFGGADWREVRQQLRDLGFIDGEGRLLAPGAFAPVAAAPAAPTDLERRAAAQALWDEAEAIGPLARRLLSERCVSRAVSASAIRQHPAVPASVYQGAGPRRPALVAAVRAPGGELTAVELTDLGHQAQARRKTIGLLPPGSAVRLDPPGAELLVAEGVFTALSASERFGLPAWALLSARNLARWSPPPAVRSVIVAVDRDPTGRSAASQLLQRLADAGLSVRLAEPPAPFGDWNDWAVARVRR